MHAIDGMGTSGSFWYDRCLKKIDFLRGKASASTLSYFLFLILFPTFLFFPKMTSMSFTMRNTHFL